jgi:hypothetical protein
MLRARWPLWQPVGMPAVGSPTRRPDERRRQAPSRKRRPGRPGYRYGEPIEAALKRVFAKVGVSRQSELAALLTKLVLR